MENKTWEEGIAEDLRQEILHSGDLFLSMDAYDRMQPGRFVNDEHPMYTTAKTMDEQIDELEALVLKEGNLVECPLKHVFTKGLYSRTILMAAGALVTSMVHAEEHQYFVSQGAALVRIGDGEWQRISAPYIGITKAGTRRVLFIEAECIWSTCHATDVYPMSNKPEDISAAVELVEDQIFIKRENPLLGGFIKGNKIIKTIDK